MEYFARQLLILGNQGQHRLCKARVLIIGAGGLGSTCIPFLASTGVGHITIVDDDSVEITNLHRQILHGVSWLGKPKVDSAESRCRDINPNCVFDSINQRFDLAFAERLFLTNHFDLILDCSDNLPTRLLISDCAAKFGPHTVITGSALRTSGQCLVYGSTEFPGCYRCLLNEGSRKLIDWDIDWSSTSFDAHPSRYLLQFLETKVILQNDPQDCSSDGVLGPVPGLIGTFMALEAVRILSATTEQIKTPTFLRPGNVISADYNTLARNHVSNPNFLIYDLNSTKNPCKFIKLPGKPNCRHCKNKLITPEDYYQIPTPKYYPDVASHQILPDQIPTGMLILDVRPLKQQALIPTPNAYRIPIKELLNFAIARLKKTNESCQIIDEILGKDLVVVCRRGNASRLGVWLIDKLNRVLNFQNVQVLTLRGGLEALNGNGDPCMEVCVINRAMAKLERKQDNPEVRDATGAIKDDEGFAKTKSNSFDSPLEFLKRIELTKATNNTYPAPPIDKIEEGNEDTDSKKN